MNEGIYKLLKDRYFLEKETSWEDVANRVSALYPPIKEDIINMKFIPSTPTLTNANTKGERTGTLSSCFPMEIKDSIEGIFDAIKECAFITKSGGGVGYDFSKLRGSNEVIKSINRKSSGPLPFLNIFNSTLDGIRQGGVRRGAGMALLAIDHPQIIDFINAKKDTSKFTRFNLSVKVNNKFYKTLRNNPDKIHEVKDKGGNYYPLKNKDGKEVTVKDIWTMIMEQAWSTGEPGLFNEDIAKDRCTVTNLSDNVICNPCSEFTGIPYQSCNLASINLSKLVKNNKFDWQEFGELIKRATRYLNAVIDFNKFPLKDIKTITEATRPIGLGVMGLAHVLFKLGIPYNSKKAIKLTEEIVTYMTLKSMSESVELAKEIEPYSVYDYTTFVESNKRFFDKKKVREIDVEHLKNLIKRNGVRNSAFTSIAPTGSISTISGTSGGIEPIFALTYQRKVEYDNNKYEIIYITDPVFEEYLNNNFKDKEKKYILEYISKNKGSCQGCKTIPEEMQKVFIVAGDLTPVEHLDILEVTANNVSLSVSKTINLPNNCKKEEINGIYIDAHKRGIIGVTVYRDGSREGILVHNSNGNNGNGRIIEKDAPKRPESLPCHLYRITVHGAKWLVFVGLYKCHPYEVFAGKVNLVDIPSNIIEGNITKLKRGIYQFEHGGEIIVKDIVKIFESGWEEALTRQISTNLRHGTPVDFIVEQLSKKGTIVDFNIAIARALKKYMKQKELLEKCPACGGKLIFYEGCIKCSNPQCGFSKCS